MPDNPLLQWTLDAKRALQQAEQLSSHANKLVSDSAAALDTADSLIPKCLFLHEALRGQVVLLQRLGEGCYSVEENARREFEVFIKELDTLDIELNDVLGRLKGVVLDPGFDAVNDVELRQNPPRKSLHDFVDEQGIEELKTQLRQAIDEVQDSHDVLSSSLSTLDSEIRSLKSLIEAIPLPSSLPPLSHSSESLHHSKSITYTTHPEKQDYHAHHLALLLTSLAQHYDQTSSALKEHESPIGTLPNIDPEALEILSHDASEVNEVLEEMEDHVREIEHSSDILQTHSLEISATYKQITAIFSQLEDYGKGRLPAHLAGVRDFEARAALHRTHISTLKQEMFNLVEYYTNFSVAYDALLGEVRRRGEVQQHTGILVNEIAQKLASLHDQEIRSRQGFMDKHAAFLPEDLWRGIYDPPTRFSVHAEEGGVLPLLRDMGAKRLSSAGMERRRSGQIGGMGGSGESSGRRSVDSGGRRSAEIQPRR